MEEPNAIVRWVIYFFGGGDAGILGGLSIALIVILSLFVFPNRRPRRVIIGVAVALALIFVACGSVPVPIWFQVSTALWLVFVFWVLGRRNRADASMTTEAISSKADNLNRIALLSSIIWVVAAIAIESPHHLWWQPSEPASDLLVIGDSVTAGLNDGEDTWPKKLSRSANVVVWDASQPGATLQSARQQNLRLSGREGLVVLEIGGNDMLEGLPVLKFEKMLDVLLKETSLPGRTIVMFELPLPPFCAGYGAAQRRLAAQYKVHLIPKRFFAQVLTAPGSTVDGIHLSDQGQTKMKELIEWLLGDRLKSGSGTYERLERVSNSTAAGSLAPE